MPLSPKDLLLNEEAGCLEVVSCNGSGTFRFIEGLMTGCYLYNKSHR